MNTRAVVAAGVLAVSVAVTALLLLTSRQLTPSEPQAVAPTVRALRAAISRQANRCCASTTGTTAATWKGRVRR